MNDEQASAWDGMQRRNEQHNILFELIHQTNQKLDTLTEKLDGHTTRLDNHVLGEETLFKKILSGFPGDDPTGHRRYHDAEIKRLESRKEFWDKLRFELTKWGLFGFLGWASYQLWLAFLHGPNK